MTAWFENRKQPTNSGGGPVVKPPPREGDRKLGDVMLEHEEVKLQERRLKVQHLEGKSVDLDAARRRVHRIYRLVRDRVQGFVPRAVPALAAELKLDEGTLYRALDREVRGLLTELATLPLEQLLGEDEPEVDE